jgi:ATP-dependent Clp protease ATP-binding subunit ClpX
MSRVNVYLPDDLAAEAKRSTGARGLRAILEEVLLNTMYDLPGRDDIERVMIDRDVVEKKVNPTLVPHDPASEEPTERTA